MIDPVIDNLVSSFNKQIEPTTPVLPQKGFVLKTQTMEESNYPSQTKVFINVCYSDEIPSPPLLPQDQILKLIADQDNSKYRVPMSCSKARNDVDKKGKVCIVYDVCINTVPYKMCENEQFKTFIIELCLEWLEENLPKMASKGQLVPHYIKQKRPVIQQTKIRPKYIVQKDDFVSVQVHLPQLETVKDLALEIEKNKIFIDHELYELTIDLDCTVYDGKAHLNLLSTLMLSLLLTFVSAISLKIKNVVVLVQENRSFDTLAGGFDYDPSINGLVGKSFCNPTDVNNPSTTVCSDQIQQAQDVVSDDPDHSLTGTSFDLYSQYVPDEQQIKNGQLVATMQGFMNEQENRYGNDNVRASAILNYYHPSQVPVFHDLARNYLLFDEWFCAVPGPTNPNRAYVTSGTSHGSGDNDDSIYSFGGFTHRSIFQQLTENGVSWINYSNSSGTSTGYIEKYHSANGFNPDSLFYDWTWSSGVYKKQVKGIKQFFTDAKNGNLPQFSYINPECCSFDSMHPPSPISMGEAFVKKIYDALVSSPQWNQTLFILTFDEAGGFADHVPPPVNVPAGDALTYQQTAPDGQTATFDFTRLGVRVPTLLISPWVGKGVVEHQAQTGAYTHTSIPKFLSSLWNLDANKPLTPRVAWSASIDHLILDSPRNDKPKLSSPNLAF
ncbi:hypothetical protein HK103_000297 [Boothiomyces macroporosus]|uniref:PIH1 N-terminal domain-containing protein n=1 Tax=Boothiomyces macroporosus TaxID=261099 RepID=A0AAD5UKT7_9FUNG|nr:hypothetical protein HK103_000275 [Boothiomyces macroporosus]KAJ3260687.1 hypothetical protein HK103_000297 [Boothiomyces macroporosus]